MEYSVDKSDLQTSLERKIEELELAVAQYVTMTTRTCHSTADMIINTHTHTPAAYTHITVGKTSAPTSCLTDGFKGPC